MKPIIMFYGDTLVNILVVCLWISLGNCDNRDRLKDSFLTHETKDSLIIHVDKPHNEELKRSIGASVECLTNKGTPGECKPFHECFPILTEKSDSDGESIVNDAMSEDMSLWTELQEEVFENTKSASCSGLGAATNETSNFTVCCEIFKPNDNAFDDDPLQLKKEELLTDAEDLLPSSCGQTFKSARDMQGFEKVPKIVGGKDTKPGQFPWMVAIFGKNKKHTCGASLINNEYILTASHCLFTYNANDISHLTVHMGDHNIKTLADGPHETRKISKIILHKGFNSKTYFNDIALMKLDSPVNYTSKIQPICLPDRIETKELEGSSSIVMGWGRDRQWGQASSVLKSVEIPVWKFDACSKVFSTFAPGRLMESNICAGDGRKSKDACIGDSGGPLVVRDIRDGSRWTHIGIVSWGKGCGSFPGVYTATRSFLPWIIKNLRN